MASVRVKIGDAIEFAPLEGASSATMASGRVMDVNPHEPELCTVQISPYEPLRSINLHHHAYKIVYAVGDINLLTPRMKGWQIEIANDVQQMERAVIKRVDSDINCALVAFESGKKEWLDLTLAAFKVVVENADCIGSSGDPISGKEEDQQHEAVDNQKQNGDAHFRDGYENTNDNEWDTAKGQGEAASETSPHPMIPVLQIPTRAQPPQEQEATMQFRSKTLPETDVSSFDWYAEGGHVEICDVNGVFLEGAILCSKTDSHVQLYNEAHQFFEVSVASQSFKVIIHGLLSLKTVPMGQSVEVYSAMTGGFCHGTVMKTAEVGKLTPIRFTDGAVEWLDLSTQTLKLVFLSGSAPDLAEDELFAPHSPMHMESPTQKPHQHHRRASPLELPVLAVGQRIEVFAAESKQFTKYKVAAVSDSVFHEYKLKSQATTSSATNADAETLVNLANLRCRIPLQSHMWDEHRRILPGHRIDIYDKVEKLVTNAKVIEVGTHGSQHSILARYKDGKKSWIYAHNVKIKLRWNGEPLSSDASSHLHRHSDAAAASDPVSAADSSAIEDRSIPYQNESKEMWGRQERGATSPEPESQSGRPTTKPHLPRQQSDLAHHTVASPAAHLTHFASLTDLHADKSIEIDSMTMTQKIPSVIQPLDFSSLRKLKSPAANDEPVYTVAAEDTTSATHSDSSRHSSRSSKSDRSVSSSSSSRLPFSMEDVWKEEFDPVQSRIEYVHIATGSKRQAATRGSPREAARPLWLQRCDPSTGKLYVIHTATNTLYARPDSNAAANLSLSKATSSATGSATGSARSLSRGDSGLAVPIGPIEAVRVSNLLDQLSDISTQHRQSISENGDNLDAAARQARAGRGAHEQALARREHHAGASVARRTGGRVLEVGALGEPNQGVRIPMSLSLVSGRIR